MVRAYYKRLTSEDPKVLQQAAKTWSIWEGATSFLQLNPEYVAKFQEDEYAAAFARIECHYFINNCFLRTDNQLLEDVGSIRHIPAVIRRSASGQARCRSQALFIGQTTS